MHQEEKIEKFFCNDCSRETKHFIRAEYSRTDEADGAPEITLTQRMLIIECCGCEHLALVKMTQFSEDFDVVEDIETGQPEEIPFWVEAIYPPVTYRSPPPWFEDLPDPTICAISEEIYKSLQTGSNYLAAFGSRTLIDRLIILTVGDQGNFGKGLNALQAEGMLSSHEREILEPVVQAGHAAAHRGWAPTKEQLATILDTVEGLIHRLLVLPKLAEELEEAVPSRTGRSVSKSSGRVVTVSDKVDIAPKDLRSVFDRLVERLKMLGDDVTVHPQKHYIAFRRNRNFASVQIYNQKKLVRIYLNIDPESVPIDTSYMRDVRQIGHFGTGDLEITIRTKADIEKSADLMRQSYDAS